jgi:hypothetical protein
MHGRAAWMAKTTKRRSKTMKNVFRKFSVIAIVLFAVGITGCLSDNKSSNIVQKQTVKDPKVDPKPPTVTTKPAVTTGAIYNPTGNKKPTVTYFGTDDLNTPVAAQGQKIELKASAVDPEEASTIIKYVATGGTVTSENGKYYWTAPNVGGIYQIKAIANDGVLDSDPLVLTIKVNGKVGGIQVGNIAAAVKNSAKRAISASSVQNPAKLVINTGDTLTLSLDYTSAANCSISPEFSVASNMGSLQLTTPDLVGPAYTQVYTYTAPTAAPASNTVTITFNIVNNSDATDYATASVTLVVNTPPTITNVTFSGNTSSINPSTSKTIQVTTSEVDTGDEVTYQYSVSQGTGTLSESTNKTGTVEYTSGAVTGTEKVTVIAIDKRGGQFQSVFVITNASPMLLKVADDAAPDYAGALTSSYDITTTGTPTASTPVKTNYNTETLPDNGLEAFTADVPAGATPVYTWYDYPGTTTAGIAFANTFSNVTSTPDWYAQYPGVHTLKVKAVAGAVTEENYDTVYVNEAPNITRISYVDSDGNTQTLWDGTTISVPQLSPGDSINLAVTVNDPDNDRVTPTNDANGYFSDTAAKFAVITPNSAANWSLLGDMSTQVLVNTLGTYANVGVAAGTLKQTITNPLAFQIKPQAASGSGQYKYLVFRAADGFDNAHDGTATYSGTITADPSVMTVLPDANGISKAYVGTTVAVTSATDLDLVRIGYHPQKTIKAGDFYLEMTAAATWKIYDRTLGTYIKNAAGTVITIANGSGNGTLAVADALPAPYDWLLVDLNTPPNFAIGDKVYFKTNAVQVVMQVEVIDGPKLTSISYNKYVTLGQTMDIQVYGDNNGSAASVSVSEITNSNGTLDQGTDSDGDLITKEKWTYTAPSTMPSSSTATFNVTITDPVNGKKTTRQISIGLNRNPTIGSVNATSSVDTTNGVWAKKGAHNISLSAVVSDLDTTDIFGYLWNLPTASSGSLQFSSTASSTWEPYNGAAPLTATGGPTLNGHYPIQLTVFDKDTTGIAKTGIAAKTIDIGINEDPIVGRDLADTGYVDGLVSTRTNTAAVNTAYDASNGSPWFAAGDVTDNGTATGSGSGTTTIDFNTNPTYPKVKVTATPQGVNDELDDKNSLNYSYYITIGTKEGPMLTTETVEYRTVTDSITSIANKAFVWTPSDSIRKDGGTFWLHVRVTDDKNGVAKGIADFTEKVVITKDNTAPVLAADNQIIFKLNGVVKTGAAAGSLKIGDKLTIKIPRNTAGVAGGDTAVAASGIRDLNGVSVDLGNFALAVYAATVYDLILKDNGTAADPTDDWFEYTYTVPEAAGAASQVDTEIAAPVAIANVTPKDLVGNVGAPYAATTLTLDIDNEAPKFGALTNTTATNAINDDGTAGSILNGDTGLQVALTRTQTAVAHIGSRVGIDIALAEALGADEADATRVAAIADFSNFNPKAAAGGSYVAIATNDLVTVDGKQNQLVLDTAATAVYADPTDNTALVLGESSTVSTWGATPVYNITFKSSDNAKAAMVAPTWPAAANVGNQDVQDINFLSWALVAAEKGIDLKRPTATSVELYSFNKNAVAGQAGYAPVVLRTGTDLADFAGIDATVVATTVLAAQNIIDDNNTSTAEILKITFDEPLFVGQDITTAAEAGAAGTNGLLGTTVNDYSIKLYQYRSNGIDKDDVSQGAVTAVAAGADSIDLTTLKNFAYTQTGATSTDTSTVYILIGSKRLTGTVAVGAVGTTLTGTGTSFTSELAAGDIIEIYDAAGAAGNKTGTYTVTSVTNDTTAVITNTGAHGNIAAGATFAKPVQHIAQGNHFEVIFADYSSDTTLDATTGPDTSDMFKILCDQHANAINATQNNYVKGHNEISY